MYKYKYMYMYVYIIYIYIYIYIIYIQRKDILKALLIYFDSLQIFYGII